jgi:two-component system response regulator YesN
MGVFDYLEVHLTENIGLKEITQDCNVSQGYLSRIFKVEFGVSVMEYIHMRKMMLAKWYFLDNRVSLTDVAYRLGYNESSYFSKVFKKYEHVTVLEYKKSL